jgi:hypothetical protein
MEKVYLLYRTDEHLSHASKELIFVGSLLCHCITAAKKDGATDEQLKSLYLRGQSQCNNTENEYLAETYNIDEF